MTTELSTRWAGVGHSASADATLAGRAAASSAVAERAGAKLLVVFASERYDLEALLGGIVEVAGDVPIVGCSTAGEIATGGPGDASVVVFALGGSGFSVATTAREDASSDLRAAGREATAVAHAVAERRHRVVLMLTDALAGDQQEILRGAYEEVGAAVPLVGGCAGDDLKMEGTFQLHGRRVLSNAVVTAAIGSDAPFGIGVKHGWKTVGDPMIVTKSDGHVVHELDGRPALDVYLERLAAPADAAASPAAFTQFALVHPLGLARRDGDANVRFVGEADFATRSLICIASMPEGAAAWLMEGDHQSVLTATDAACDQALAGLGTDHPVGVLAFDCIARKGVLGGEGIKTEITRLGAQVNGAPVAGFYTYGEIARTKGINGFHNETLVVLAIG